jgi:hypothetical protein
MAKGKPRGKPSKPTAGVKPDDDLSDQDQALVLGLLVREPGSSLKRYDDLSEEDKAAILAAEYFALANEGKKKFLLRIAQSWSGRREVPYTVYRSLTDPDGRFRFPVLAVEELRQLWQQPGVNIEEFTDRVMELFTEQQWEIYDVLQAEFKRDRERQPSVEMILRNAGLCDDHARPKDPLTFGRLAMKHKLAKETVREIWQDRQRWWRLREELGVPPDAEREGEGG